MSYDSDVEIIEDGAPKLYPDLKPPTEDDDVMIIEDMAAPEIVDEGSSEEKHRKLAEKKKEEGNLAYTAKRYRQALELYTQAIELCPQCASYYNNRSACHLMLNQHDKALQEAREAVRLDPKYIKGHLRVAKCQLALGDAAGAEAALSAAAALGADSSAVSAERRHVDTLAGLTRELDKAGAGGDQRRALFCCDRALILSPGSASLRTRRAECLLALGRLAEAQQSVQDLLRTDAINADALYVRGLCLYRQDDMERAVTHFQQVLRLAPDHQRAKTAYKRAKQLRALKESGNAAFKQGRMEEALRQYGEALLVDPDNAAVNSKLHFNRATVLARQRKLQPALQDCNKAIELSSDYLKAYQRRAKCYMDLERYEEAVRDYEKVCSMDRSAENRQLLSNAKLELKKSKRKDFYKILGVSRDASDEEIKKAYRKQALVHHPDRHSNASEEVRVQQEHKFKEVGEAYSVLSNRQKRRRYDTGQDLDDSCGSDGCHQPDFDPNTVFQAFFGGGAGGAGVPPGAAPGGFRYNMGGGHHHQQQYQFQPGAGPGFQFRFG